MTQYLIAYRAYIDDQEQGFIPFLMLISFLFKGKR